MCVMTHIFQHKIVLEMNAAVNILRLSSIEKQLPALCFKNTAIAMGEILFSICAVKFWSTFKIQKIKVI